jgi:Domain of unknown function (DUF4129)
MVAGAISASWQETSWDADRARAEARDILSERRFSGVDPPRPLRGAFETLGRWIRQGFEAIVDVFPGGDSALWTVIGLVVVAAAALVARAVIRRHRTEGANAALGGPGVATSDPRRLEFAADAAEKAGDLERAIRLRFRAGLLRLGDAGAIDWHPSITTGQVSSALESGDFDDVARIFEEVVYGRRTAAAPDVARTRAGWQRVLAGAA